MWGGMGSTEAPAKASSLSRLTKFDFCKSWVEAEEEFDVCPVATRKQTQDTKSLPYLQGGSGRFSHVKEVL